MSPVDVAVAPIVEHCRGATRLSLAGPGEDECGEQRRDGEKRSEAPEETSREASRDV
jgi:hypothetical protein